MLPVVVSNACLFCNMGCAPSNLIVLPSGNSIDGMFVATVNDHKPGINIQSFSQCTSMANPVVAQATAEALGTLMPAPCVPLTPMPWESGEPNVLSSGPAILTMEATLFCLNGGIIRVVNPGQCRKGYSNGSLKNFFPDSNP